jgi:predicted N-acetyltransferase YhbS
MMLVAIIRVYDHPTDAADAVQELRKAGVPEHDISVLTRDDRVTGVYGPIVAARVRHNMPGKMSDLV